MRRRSIQLTSIRRGLAALSAMGVLYAGICSGAPLPDLVVSDFWEANGTIHFTLENIGAATAQAGHSAFLRVNGKHVDSAYIGVSIAAGKTYATQFNQYSWQCTAGGQYTLIVLADIDDRICEKDETNNALDETIACDAVPLTITYGPSVQGITTSSAAIRPYGCEELTAGLLLDRLSDVSGPARGLLCGRANHRQRRQCPRYARVPLQALGLRRDTKPSGHRTVTRLEQCEGVKLLTFELFGFSWSLRARAYRPVDSRIWTCRYHEVLRESDIGESCWLPMIDAEY